LPVFTLAELSTYSGANGTTAYIAVDGVIYDVTNEYTNGQHQGMQLGGTDASAAFASSPHSASTLASLPIVGTLEGSPRIIDTTKTASASQTTTSEPVYLPIFTLPELSAYTGAQGTTAYIAVNGVVYNVTNVFSNGQHQGMQLGGTDATAIFSSSPHSMSLLATLPIVGTLEGTAPIIDETATPPVVETPVETVTLPVFTLLELETFTGANGTTAYIAVNGVVYDVTNAFSNGQHQGMQLGGTDASAIFANSPHSASFLANLRVVGSLEGFPVIVDSTDLNTGGSNSYDDDDDDDHDEYEDDDDDDHDDDDHDEYEDD
jgi:predicted heme/steroid binding protein